MQRCFSLFMLMCFTSSLFAVRLPSHLKHLLPKTKTPLQAVLPFVSPCGITLTAIPPNSPLIIDFATKAALQTFTYDYKNVSLQFNELEPCFTKTGWESFHNAIQQSGNIKATSKDKLIVTAEKDGEAKILSSDTVGLVWKMFVPIKVLYQNTTHHLKQRLNVKMVIVIENKKLGIEQIIASQALPVKPKSEDGEDDEELDEEAQGGKAANAKK